MTFLHDNFLLKNETGRVLYHQLAAGMPIYDYHCHLSAREIYENKPYESIGHMMLGGDHYKWRAMRAAGISENSICGADDYFAKFMAFSKTLSLAPGNPLLHWTHLELKRVFGIQDTLTSDTALSIYLRAGERLAQLECRPRGLIKRFNVKMVCTTDDPGDNLRYHAALIGENLPFRVLPAFRPDRAMKITLPDFPAYARTLGKTAGVNTQNLRGFLDALEMRLIAFHDLGARLADHALDEMDFERTGADTARRIYREAMLGRSLERRDVVRFRSFLLCWLGARYAERGWTQQYHIGAMRNTNSRMFALLGPDTGFDSIGDGPIAQPLSRLLDAMDRRGELPKTILYSLNPGDNYILASMCGNFQDGQTRGKLQWGSAWWFNDQRDGMEAQLRGLGNLGLLGCFVGMLTDSRSFVSYTRHEYFRRIFCNLVGEWAEGGEIPDDPEVLLKLTEDICYNNAVNFFDMGGENLTEMPTEK